MRIVRIAASRPERWNRARVAHSAAYVKRLLLTDDKRAASFQKWNDSGS